VAQPGARLRGAECAAAAGERALSNARPAVTTRFAGLSRPAFGALAAIGAQTAADAERLRRVGARRVEVTGSVKFDIAPPRRCWSAVTELRRLFGESRRILLAASTREGEEATSSTPMSAGACRRPATPGGDRAPPPAAFRRGGGGHTRSGPRLPAAFRRRAHRPATRVVLGDSMGEMFAYYAACDVAFVGGSLLPWAART